MQTYPKDSLSFDWRVAGLSLWLIGGLYLDGWAHHHGRVDDTFFTPWHLVLYSGVLSTFGFLSITHGRNMAKGQGWRHALPRGYLLALCGVGLFLLAGGLDFIWHTLFGIEVSVEALLSPPHLLLAASGVLALSGPLCAAWMRAPAETTPGWRSLGPAVLSMTLALSVITFFTQFAHPISQPITPTANSSDTTPATFSDLYVMHADGTGQTRLTASPDTEARYGAWSADGRQLAFTRRAVNAHGEIESSLYLSNADGSGVRPLGAPPGEDYWATWSPDGTRLAFVARAGEQTALYIMRVDGRDLQQVSTVAADYFGPAWSPDGTRIAYTSNASGTDQLYLIDADGGNPTQLTTQGTHTWGAAWSPDGQWLAVASNRADSLDIYALSADGRETRRLTDTPDDDYAPTWSPDGSQIAFVSWHAGTADIFVIPAAGGTPRNLTQSHALELNFPKWSPDGQSILFTANGHATRVDSSDTQSLALASILLQAGVLMGATLLLVRRWTLPGGALTLMFTLNGVLMSVFNERLVLALPMLGAGLIADGLLGRLKPSGARAGAFLLFAFLVPVVHYALYFLTLSMTSGVDWGISLWLGSIFMAGGIGFLMALTMILEVK